MNLPIFLSQKTRFAYKTNAFVTFSWPVALPRKLIDANADMRIADSEGLTAMDYAIRSTRGLKGFDDILELLLTAIDKDTASPELSAHFENQVRQYQAAAQDKSEENPDAVDVDVQHSLVF